MTRTRSPGSNVWLASYGRALHISPVDLDQAMIEVDALQHKPGRSLDRFQAHRCRFRAAVQVSLDRRTHAEQREHRHQGEREALNPDRSAQHRRYQPRRARRRRA